MCFLKNIAEFLRTASFIEHLRWLLCPNDFAHLAFLHGLVR